MTHISKDAELRRSHTEHIGIREVASLYVLAAAPSSEGRAHSSCRGGGQACRGQPQHVLPCCSALKPHDRHVLHPPCPRPPITLALTKFFGIITSIQRRCRGLKQTS